MEWLDPLALARIFVCAFFAVLFLQSGLDKIFDFNGNLAWMQPHFAKSPMKAMVPALLSVMTVVEMSAGAASGVGVVVLMLGRTQWAVIGLGLSCLALVMLFAGQRIAKDYAGAATLATYFGVAVLGLLIMS